MRKSKSSNDRAARIYRQLASAGGMDDHERWQHAPFFAMSPQERCHFSLKTARPLGAFLKALHEEGIDFILIGAMAAIKQGRSVGDGGLRLLGAAS